MANRTVRSTILIAASFAAAAVWMFAQSALDPGALQVPQPWPQPGHDAQRSSRAAVRGPGPLAPQTAFTLPQIMSISLPVGGRNGRLYATARVCMLGDPQACLASTDTLISFTPRGRTDVIPLDRSVQYYGNPALGDDGTIYVSSSLGLRALNADGTVKWTFADSSGSPVLTNQGLILTFNDPVGSPPPTWYALDSEGNLQWSAVATWPYGGVAVAPNGNIYYMVTSGLGDCSLLALDATGNFMWSRLFCPPIDRTPSPAVSLTPFSGLGSYTPSIAADGTIYVALGEIYALRPDGTVKWVSNLPDYQVTATPAIAAGGTIYAETCTPGVPVSCAIVALNPDDGSTKWSYPIKRRGENLAVDSAGAVYAVDRAGITAVRASGELKWRWATPLSALDIYTVFVFMGDGTLVALHGRDGVSIGFSAAP